MNQSENITELAAALTQIQSMLPIVGKSSKGYGYQYADLAETIRAVQAPLEKCKLCIVHQIKQGEGVMILSSRVMHASGQWVGMDMPLLYRSEGKVNEMQALGSAITYAKRYAIGCLLNLAADDDDAASTGSPKLIEPSQDKKISEQQYKALSGWGATYPKAIEVVYKENNISSLRDLPLSVFPKVMKRFEVLHKANQGRVGAA